MPCCEQQEVERRPRRSANQVRGGGEKLQANRADKAWRNRREEAGQDGCANAALQRLRQGEPHGEIARFGGKISAPAPDCPKT